jgi:hypothetical protein
LISVTHLVEKQKLLVHFHVVIVAQSVGLLHKIVLDERRKFLCGGRVTALRAPIALKISALGFGIEMRARADGSTGDCGPPMTTMCSPSPAAGAATRSTAAT